MGTMLLPSASSALSNQHGTCAQRRRPAQSPRPPAQTLSRASSPRRTCPGSPQTRPCKAWRRRDYTLPGVSCRTASCIAVGGARLQTNVRAAADPACEALLWVPSDQTQPLKVGAPQKIAEDRKRKQPEQTLHSKTKLSPGGLAGEAHPNVGRVAAAVHAEAQVQEALRGGDNSILSLLLLPAVCSTDSGSNGGLLARVAAGDVAAGASFLWVWR